MNMAVAKPCRSPTMLTTCRLSATDGVTYSDPYVYRHVGSVQYLSFTRPDLSFSVHKVSKFTHNPLDTHWQAVERILWYLKHTISTGLYLQPSSSCNLQAFFDSDWATYHDDQWSVGAYCAFTGKNLISWHCKSLVDTASVQTILVSDAVI